MFIIFILSYKYYLNCLVPSFIIKQRNKLLLHRFIIILIKVLFIIILIKVISKIKKIRNNDNNNISDSINFFYQFFIFIFIFFNYFTGSLYFSRLTTTFSEVSPATVSAKTNFPNSF